jgi:predicted flap endonuclease-1-like 5' DNA nuclease
MVDPLIIGGVVSVAAVASAAVYSWYTGKETSASADFDNDGDDEVSVTFAKSHDDPASSYIESDDDTAANGSDDGDDGSDSDVADDTDSDTNVIGGGDVPDEVADKDGLTDVKGIGESRAEAFVDEGYRTVADLYYASGENLTNVDGIGDRAVQYIREDIGGIDYGDDTEEDDTDEEDGNDTDDSDGDSSGGSGSNDSDSSTDEDEAS